MTKIINARKSNTTSDRLASGLIPLVFHVDGAEFYSNCEYYVWSLGSVLASGEARVATSLSFW